MQRRFVLEIPIFAVQRKARRGDGDDPRMRAALADRMVVAGGQNGDIMPQLRTDEHFLLDIGTDPAAMG